MPLIKPDDVRTFLEYAKDFCQEVRRTAHLVPAPEEC